MGRPTFKKLVEKQIKLWEERVWRPELVPEKEQNEEGELVLVDNEEYNNIFKGSKFNVIFCKDYETIYKLFRYGIEKGKVYNSNILFARTALFETYIAADESLKDSYNLCQELFRTISPNNSFESKWLICESIDTDFNDKLASYFITQLQNKKSAGLVFSCNTKYPNNLYSCIKSSGIANIITL